MKFGAVVLRLLAVVSRLLAPLVVFLAALGIAWWLLQTPAKISPEKSPALTANPNERVPSSISKPLQEKRPQVRVNAFPAKAWPLPLEVAGVVRSALQVSLFSEVEGRVVHIHPNLSSGAVIERGESLVSLSAPHLDAQLAMARAQLWQAKQKLEQATAQVSAAGEVPGLQTPSAYRQSLLAVQKTAVQAAESEVNAVLNRVSSQVIKAPFTGRFSGTTLSVGQSLPMGQEIGQFNGTAKLIVDVNVNGKHLELLKRSPDQAQDVKVLIAQNVGRSAEQKNVYFPGVLTTKEGTLDPITGLTRLSLEVVANATELVPGERVATRLMFTSSQPLLRLPLGIVKGNEVTGVKILSDGSSASKNIKPYGKIVRHELNRVLTDRRFGYFAAKPASVLYVVPRPRRWLLPGHEVDVLLEQDA